MARSLGIILVSHESIVDEAVFESAVAEEIYHAVTRFKLRPVLQRPTPVVGANGSAANVIHSQITAVIHLMIVTAETQLDVRMPAKDRMNPAHILVDAVIRNHHPVRMLFGERFKKAGHTN